MNSSLALLAFELLSAELGARPARTLEQLGLAAQAAAYAASAPVFVTWTKKGNLRGCIGTFQSGPTESQVTHYALASAFEDPRFAPIAQRELPLLRASVTLLAHFEHISDPFQWELGRHGLQVQFRIGLRRYLGTFLPNVAVEQEWDQEETLVQLLRKAGKTANSLHDYESLLLSGDMTLTRYEGLKSEASFADYTLVVLQETV